MFPGFLRDMADRVPRVCLSPCAFLCVWQPKQWLVKGCDSVATYRGHHPQDPGGWTAQYCATHTHADTYVGTNMLFTEEHWGPASLVTCVCKNHTPPFPPATAPHPQSSSCFSPPLQIPADFKTDPARKKHKWNKYKHSETLTGMKIKERRRHFSYFLKGDEFGAEWTGQRGFGKRAECFCKRVCVCACVCQPSVLIKHTGV